jgi:sugar phosphate isomerase/epimerase
LQVTATKLSFSNGTFSKRPLQENLAAVKALGFENIEFNLKSLKVEADISVYTAKQLLTEHGLTCLTLHAATLPVKDAIEVHRAVYYGKLSADCAHLLSAHTMVVHSNVSRKLPPDQRKLLLARIFREVKPYAEGLGSKLALENLSYASMGYGKNVAELEEILGVIDGAESMGVTLDFCHATATGVTQSLLEKYHRRLCNVHLSNRAHKPFMEQTPALTSFIGQLRQRQYRGPVTLELNRRCTQTEILTTKRVVETVMGVD